MCTYRAVMFLVVLILGALLFPVLFLQGSFTSGFLSICRSISMLLFPPTHFDRHQQALGSAASGFAQYSCFAHRELSRMRNSYSRMGRQHKRIGYELGYPRKLNALAQSIAINSAITIGISELAREAIDHHPRGYGLAEVQTYQQLEKIREVLKHFVRDWSEEGAEERTQTFSVILEVFENIPYLDRKDITILIPGAGLARLPWELAVLGFNTTSNEISPYMNLAFRFLLSRSTTSHIHQHVIHPFAHWFSHQRTNASLFRTVTFPDILPSLFPVSSLRHNESDFLDLASVSGGYDYIVTYYFIDTSQNVITTLQKIHSLLRTGGTWINLGPLLWMSGAQATMELSLDEVLELSRAIGFEIQEGKRQSVPSEYTRDDDAMMRWIYEAEFWIAIKI